MNTPIAKNATKKSNGAFTWAQAFRDIVVTSMNRGQLPMLGLLGIALTLVWKMPEQDVSRLVFEIIGFLKAGELVAYLGLIVSLGGWFFHSKRLRKSFSLEVERIAQEKSQLQIAATATRFKSSKAK